MAALRIQGLGRFGFLLIALIAFLVTTPFAVDTAVAELRFRVLFMTVLLIGVYTMRRGQSMVIALVLSLASLVAGGLSNVAGLPRTYAYVASIMFMGYVGLVVLAQVLREKRVTTDTVLGGVCVYLLTAVGWALVYGLALEFDPQAILDGGELIHDKIEQGSSIVLYFSFVTLTGLGYGDITPNNDTARMLTGAEAVIGQLFIAVLIARLVGMHISTTRQQKRDEEPI